MLYIDQFPYTEEYSPHVYVYDACCSDCGAFVQLTVPAQGLFDYRHGTLVQKAFPNMSITDREFFIRGWCSKCQDEFYNHPPEEDEEDVPCPFCGRMPSDNPPHSPNFCPAYEGG